MELLLHGRFDDRKEDDRLVYEENACFYRFVSRAPSASLTNEFIFKYHKKIQVSMQVVEHFHSFR